MKRWAEVIGVTTHTLRRWERAAEQAEGPAPGRPPRSAEERARARELVRAAAEEQGWSAGEGPVHRALGGAVSRRLTRELLAELKRDRRRRRREALAQVRVTNRVHARDALWAQDATHLARDEEGHSVEAEVIREVASTRTLEISVGRAADADDVIAALERARSLRGTLPLVWASDNGSPYVSRTLRRYLARNQVVHLCSLPRTPQHNPWAEHGMRELKEEAELDGVRDVPRLRERLGVARDRLDRSRLRRSRGWRTALQADRRAPPAESLVSRQRFYAAACCAVRNAVLHSCSKRERRRAAREAVLQCMQRFGLITRTRAGVPLTLANSYRVS